MDPAWRSEFRHIFARYGALSLVAVTLGLANMVRLFFVTTPWWTQGIAMAVGAGLFGVPMFRLGFRFWRLLPIMDEQDRRECEDREVKRRTRELELQMREHEAAILYELAGPGRALLERKRSETIAELAEIHEATDPTGPVAKRRHRGVFDVDEPIEGRS